MNDALPFAPAAARNEAPILEVLRRYLVSPMHVLEVGSGTGQHATAFSRALPGLRWQPTDREDALNGLAARIAHEAVDGVAPPRVLDVETGPWPDGPFDAAFTANTCHIMSWKAVQAMVAGVSRVLRPGGPFLVYGPFFEAGIPAAEGNRRFDAILRENDPRQGLREVEALESVARRHHCSLTSSIPMPANNLTLVFTRDE